MTGHDTIDDIDARIAIVRDNLRTLVEQASAHSGAADEARTADRIGEQEALLAKLLQQHDVSRS